MNNDERDLTTENEEYQAELREQIYDARDYADKHHP